MSTGVTQIVKQPKLVTVVITCYNHAGYLPDAIRSVLGQSYKPIEIIVVDDGSTDNTREVAEGFREVKYVYQTNRGLPAARNTGIAASTGDYLVFLDADDWLLPQAIETNVKYFDADEQIGLVSGSYTKFFEKTGKLVPIEKYISQDVYAELLLSNYLRMHGAVMFSRVVFEQLQYDTHLRSSEDWDMTLAVSRRYPIVQHKEPIAIYRKYGASMSSNLLVMLESGVAVLDKQRKFVRTSKEAKNLKVGRRTLTRKFTKRIYEKICKEGTGSKPEIAALLKHNPVLYLKYLLKSVSFRKMSRS